MSLNTVLPYSPRIYVCPEWARMLLCGSFAWVTLTLCPIKTDLAEVLVIKGLLGINILSCARIKLVLVWTPPTPSKQWFLYCRIMTAENVVNQASRLGCSSVRGANNPLVASLCGKSHLSFCVQVEHVHPSPGSVWCWGSVSCQDPGLLLSMALLLKPVLQGVDTGEKCFYEFHTFTL